MGGTGAGVRGKGARKGGGLAIKMAGGGGGGKEENETKNNLRYSLRNVASNSFGKKISELSNGQLKTALDIVLKQYWPLAPDKDAFKRVFKATFKTHLKRLPK